MKSFNRKWNDSREEAVSKFISVWIYSSTGHLVKGKQENLWWQATVRQSVLFPEYLTEFLVAPLVVYMRQDTTPKFHSGVVLCPM